MSSSSPPSSESALSRLHALLKQLLRITTTDGRVFIGTFAGTDKPLNIILVNAEEYRLGPDQDADGRYVGQVMLPWKVVVKVEAHIQESGLPRNQSNDGMYMYRLSRALSFVSPSMVLSGIVDDVQPGFIIYSGNQWTHSNRNSNYNRTITEYQVGAQSPTLPPSFSFTFYGTAVNIYGGPITTNTAFNYSIDNGTLKPAIIGSNAVGKIGVNIWSLTGLIAGQHTLQVIPVAGLFSLDYITFTPTTLTTSVTRNLNVVLDDNDNSVQFTGNWSKTSSVIPGSVPYEGTRTGSSAEGDTMKIQFIGSSIFVNGLLNQGPGKLSASFSLDGGKATTFSPFDGDQDVNASSWSLSQQFYHQDLTPGEHSLVVTVQQATGSQSLWIDSAVFGSTSNTTITPSSQPDAKKGGPGKTVIGVIAGVVGLFILMWLLSKCQGKKKKPSLSEIPSEEYHPSPPQEEPSPAIPHTHHYFPVQIQNLVIANGYGTPTMVPGPNMPMEHYAESQPTLSPRHYNNRQEISPVNVPVRRAPVPPQQDGSYMPMHPRVQTSPENAPARRTSPPPQDGSYMPIPRSAQSSSSFQPQARTWDRTPLRGPSPSQQDGSDGFQHPAPTGATQESQVDGSESFTQLKPHTTLLTYHSTPQTRPSNNAPGTQSTSRATEPDDEPPPYNPYE